MNFEPVGTPAKIAFESDDLALVAAVWPVALVSGQKQAMKVHNPIHPLVVDARMALLPKTAVQHSADPAVAVGQAVVDDVANQGQQHLVLGLGVTRRTPLSGLFHPLRQPGARNRQRLGHPLHREPSSQGNGVRESSFFSRAISMAS